MKDIKETLKVFTTFMMDQTNISKSSSAQKDTLTPPDPTTAVQTNRRASSLEGGHSTNIGGMCTLKHEISSPKLYELLIKTELKGDTTLDLKNFFNNINMSLNVVTRLREYLLPDYQSIKSHSDIKEYFVPDCNHPSYSWNVQIYTSLGHSLLVAMTNNTFVGSNINVCLIVCEDEIFIPLILQSYVLSWYRTYLLNTEIYRTYFTT